MYDIHTVGEKSDEKSNRQCIEPNLAGCSAEREFRRNLRITTFEEAIKMCKNIPRRGVYVVPLGHKSPPNLPHRHTMGRDGP